MAEVKQFETDIAIIAAGGAGMAAGIEARDAGVPRFNLPLDLRTISRPYILLLTPLSTSNLRINSSLPDTISPYLQQYVLQIVR